ncbi:MAG: hypothetical protein FJ280_11570 [Planctomycetes bacterium]|nr:hypothetical protein [Planctomycetota bacterium]
MSEYQYYEFQAIDRPLTEKEMAELRSYSTRARITRTSFVNDYSWGSFKGNEDAWMEKYFDAFLYLANWGTHVLKLRLPARLLDLKTAQQYCVGDSASAKGSRGNVILSFSSDEEGGDWVEGEGELSPLIPVRAELARGDLRALYLGWLLCVQNEELHDEAIEPPVPPGLGKLDASLTSFADFLRIDEDLLDVAAQASAALEERGPSRDEVHAWAAGLPVAEKEDLLTRLIVEEDLTLATELQHRFLKDRDAGRRPGPPAARRTVGELLQAAEIRAEERRHAAARKRAAEKERHEREAAKARAKHLDEIAGRQAQLWTKIDNLIAAKQPKPYDEAVRLLLDLRDLAQREGKQDEFRRRLEAIHTAHARKGTFIQRLHKAGLE